MADRYGLRNRKTGKFARVNDTAEGPDVNADASWPVHFDRDSIGSDEQFEVVEAGTDRVLVTADPVQGRRKAIRVLSFPPGDQAPQTRKEGTAQSWERGQAVAMPDGTGQFYRPKQGNHEAHGVPTEIYELVKVG